MELFETDHAAASTCGSMYPANLSFGRLEAVREDSVQRSRQAAQGDDAGRPATVNDATAGVGRYAMGEDRCAERGIDATAEIGKQFALASSATSSTP